MRIVECDLLIEGCLLFPMDGRGPVREAALAIRDGRVVYSGRPGGDVKFRAEEGVEGRGRAILPGLINCHTHAPMTLLRGLAEDVPLDVWLKEHVWPVEAAMGPEDIYWGALLACLEMSLTGTTCFSDMYFHEDMVAEAVLKSGLRAVLSPGIMDITGPKLGEELLKGALEVFRKYDGAGGGRVRVFLGPHAIYTCSRELLERVRDEAERLGTGIHIHLSETEEEVRRCLEEYGRTPVAYLDELGLLGPRTLAAHCIYLTDEDIRLLAERGVKVAHCPVASAKIGTGVARVPEMLSAGVEVGLGTDGPASNNTLDMLETVKFACLIHKASRRDPTVLKAREALEMATIRAARALGISDQVGSLEPGKKADFVVINLRRASTVPLHDPYAAVVYSARSGAVEHVFVDGEPVVLNGEHVKLDAEAVMEEAEERALDLLRRAGRA